MNNYLTEDIFMMYNELDESKIYKYQSTFLFVYLISLLLLTKKGFQKVLYLSKLALPHSQANLKGLEGNSN